MSRLRSGAATCTCGWSSWMVPATPAGCCRCFPMRSAWSRPATGRMNAAGATSSRMPPCGRCCRPASTSAPPIWSSPPAASASRAPSYRALPPIHFSLSHGGRRCLIGIARGGDVGVDIEPIDRRGDISSMAIAVLSESEHARWGALSPARNAHRCCERAEGLRHRPVHQPSPLRDRVAAHPSPSNGQAMPEWTLEELEPDSTFVGAWAAQAPLPARHSMRFSTRHWKKAHNSRWDHQGDWSGKATTRT
ncbi:hypothetical protein ABIF38_002949 [Bradyrhizobium japonicum]|uniref:4'-phosphopantetheinyl transferase domain-containing protein n=1 Tax=Bradyrhizobium elkanii TaxID=29448 RepID=A0ABV4FCR0_BRAEL